MTFLEARRTVAAFAGGPALSFRLSMSGAADALEVFLAAAAARTGRTADVHLLPYDTLAQHLLRVDPSDMPEVVLLTPWDFAPECNWRSGLPGRVVDADAVNRRATETAGRIAARRAAGILYLAASIPPVLARPEDNATLAAGLNSHAQSLGAQVLPPDYFRLATFLASGCPVASLHLADVARRVVDAASARVPTVRKVLVTDFDDVLWKGVVAEDGPAGIACDPSGQGFRHFLYQSLLLTLKAEGVLLVGVSRNDPADALAPLQGGVTIVRESDFVAILASHNAKSAQIRLAAERLNIGLQDFVFVDNNPIELAEVHTGLPEVACLEFPASDDRIPVFFNALRRFFARERITAEDAERTTLYRRRFEGIAPAHARGADLRDFLGGLEMRLTLHDRTRGRRARGVQLINKTNQFNVNGVRLTDEDVSRILDAGGQLLTATLEDRTGNHGEILSCLVSAGGVIESFVLSCRVLERRVEHAFFAWLASRPHPPRTVRAAATARNEPARRFLADAAFAPEDQGRRAFDAGAFRERHAADLELFALTEP